MVNRSEAIERSTRLRPSSSAASSPIISPANRRAIAFELNKEGVSGPQGAKWGPSTIHGNPKRGVGILNNELYVGRLVWNRLRYLKDPDTESGCRVSILNPSG